MTSRDGRLDKNDLQEIYDDRTLRYKKGHMVERDYIKELMRLGYTEFEAKIEASLNRKRD